MSEVTLEPGDLKQWMLFQKNVSTTVDAHGQPVEDWQPWSALDATDGYMWAACTQVSGRELERAMQLYAEVTHKITTHFVAGLTPVRMRAVMDGRIFEIGWVNNVDEAGVKYEILAAERVS